MSQLHRQTSYSARAAFRGLPRFLLYAGLQIAIFLSPKWLLLIILGLVLAAGLAEKLDWLAWARQSLRVVLMVAALALAGFPFAQYATMDVARILAVWLPGLLRALRFLLIILSAAWLSHGLSALDLRQVLELLFWPLGNHIGRALARSVSLVLAFLPWTRAEIKSASEAATLRGLDARRQPIRHLSGLMVPVALRSLERARHSAEALSLRDPTL
ncbi:MAG: energy-coupling factor transporter transmembrane protein EcfT [Spirochaetes bacterium]|nr:energy-coupling factor transporter transmembrane protein EcfT [Spirochaetota bacterium]MBU0957139.1 energy-coupling factor transporter transmembrane protein EcfT [Spirochaetota bacterium]